jgi:hypothetical protein
VPALACFVGVAATHYWNEWAKVMHIKDRLTVCRHVASIGLEKVNPATVNGSSTVEHLI